MQEYKMVCLDIDGTLLNSQHKLTDNIKAAIRKVTEHKNIKVTLVSARPPKGIIPLQKELGISQPLICYSGALVLDDKLQVLENKTIPVSVVKKIYDCAKEANIHVSLYKDDYWYVEELDYWAKQEGDIVNSAPAVLNFASLFELWQKESTGPNKLLIMGQPNEMNMLNSKLKQLLFDSVNMYPSKPTYLEIMPKGASKTAAIGVLSNRFDLKPSEIMAMGDNYNDVDMLEYAGLGIAMGNAPEAVKSHADYVTLSNDEEGVAAAIYKFIML
jgi:Cof subfamily protein (haloacid dehalogenase superfamily)